MKKILLIFTLFMALTLVKAQSVYHLSIDGNQLVIENVTNSTTLAYPANNVYILQNASSETFGLYSFKGTSLGGGYSLANVRDADGVAFASFAILVDWLNKSLGGDILAPNRSYNFVADANKTGAYMRGNFTGQSAFYGGDLVPSVIGKRVCCFCGVCPMESKGVCKLAAFACSMGVNKFLALVRVV